MINWKPAHSGLIVAVSLAVSILLYYLLIVIPVNTPAIVMLIFYLIPGMLLTAVIDHGHMNSPWSVRWHRLGLSWLITAVWLIVGQQFGSMLIDGQPLSLGRSFYDVWTFLYPLFLVAAVIALIGVFLVRWIERGNTALMVIDQPKGKK